MEHPIINNKKPAGKTPDTALQENTTALANELDWLRQIIEIRVALHFGHDTPYSNIDDLPVPNLRETRGPYAAFVNKHQLDAAERLVLILALVPHIKPETLDLLCSKNPDYDRRFSQFGGLFLGDHSGLIPSAETAMFLLAGADLYKRIHYQYLFHPDHLFTRMHIISGDAHKKGMPKGSAVWMVSHEYVDHLISGQAYEAAYSKDFPAQRIHTQLEWEDIILNKSTTKSLQEIRNWIAYGDVIMQDLGLGKQLKPGYKSLFYGPPGTGKTMTAALLGKSTRQPVYKIDLSMVVSKYIGETEKNLAKVFAQAENQHWILFFDEADSLFGKRTQVNSANDRFGNQEIGYLLQRIEDFPGVVILASNLKENIDEAFTRRFQSMVEFRMPGVEERYKLWKQSFSEKLPLDTSIDLRSIAEKYELSGGVMMNVVRKATLRALTGQQRTISKKILEEAIRQELHKEGIILN